jgi:transcriptional regulator with XRE-family HTH domain
MINPKVFKQVRRALGLSQQELADQLGLSRVTINKMERGKLARGIPDEIGARLMALKQKDQGEVTAVRILNTGTTVSYVGPSDGAIYAAVSKRNTPPDEQKALDAAIDAHLWDNEEDES